MSASYPLLNSDEGEVYRDNVQCQGVEMGEVIALPSRLERGAHNSGSAICKECGHKWTAVAPVGDVALECPSCHTYKGLFEGGVYPANELWVCNCGCDVFTISATTNILCWRCGEVHGQRYFPNE